jgi:plastocyanin
VNRPAILLLATLALPGCQRSSSPAHSPSEPIASIPSRAVDPAIAGSVSGVVRFDGKPPARIAIDMSADPACAHPATPNLTEQYIVTNHKLANVYVYVKFGIPDATAPAATTGVIVDQKNCRYVPHVIALQQGGSVEFRNSDLTLHNVHTMPTQVGNNSISLTEAARSQPQTEKFKAPETMLPVRCDYHPWMSAFVNISPNQYFAVTGEKGSFTIPNLPPGTYTLAAVHEKLGEQHLQFTVSPRSVTRANFIFSVK